MGRKKLLKNVVEEPDNDDMEDLDLIIVPPDNPIESDDEQIGVELEENEDEADYQDDSEDQVVPVAKNANRNWSKNISLADFEPHRKMSILERLDIDRNLNPVELFELFFDVEVYDHIIAETKRYASASENHDFDVSIEEMKTFIGILLMSGYVVVPRWRMYWEAGETFSSTISNAMRRDRFEEIKKYGYKYWCLCTVDGYLIVFEPYQGAGRGNMLIDRNLGLGGSVVIYLVGFLPYDNHFNVFADRFFSSLKLTDKMTELGFGYTGTIQVNRLENCPLRKFDKKQQRGHYEYYGSKELLAVAWNDNRPVHMVSNLHNVFPIQQAKRWSKEKKQKISVNQPNMIKLYNQNMGGVDRMDQNIGEYKVSIGGKKWYWENLTFCIDSALHNACIGNWKISLWTISNFGKKTSIKKQLIFSRYVASSYLRTYAVAPIRPGRRSKTPESKRVTDAVRFDRVDHLILVTESRMHCAQCPGRPTTMCEKCGVGLCAKCFKPFHTKP